MLRSCFALSISRDKGTERIEVNGLKFQTETLPSIALLWSLVAVGLVRVGLGWHYPSDIVGGLVLGSGCVYLITKIKYLGTLIERFIYMFKNRTYIIDSLFVIFVADAYNLFPGLQGIVHMLRKGGERLITSP